MADFEDTKQAKIKWGDGDVEANTLRRKPSGSELSIRSINSRRGSIDPSVALPVQYRTVSFQIEEAKGGNIKSQKAKDNAAKGTCETLNIIFHPLTITRAC